MKNRILTLVIEIEDDKAAEWIWDRHLGRPDTLNTGVRVKSITSGDIPKRSDVFECGVQDYLKEVEIAYQNLQEYVYQFDWHPGEHKMESEKNDCSASKSIGNEG